MWQCRRPAVARGALRVVVLLSLVSSVSLVLPWGCQAKRSPSGIRRQAFNLAGLFGAEEEKLEVPKNVAGMVDGLKSSTENCLNQGCSRLDVELPPSFQLGVEDKGRKSAMLADKSKEVVLKEVARGDRELARLFVEMLEAIGPGLVVAFRSSNLAKAARKRWKLDPLNEAQVISFFDSKKSAFTSEVEAPAQFYQKLKDLDCKCLLVVGPQLEQLRFVAKLSKEVRDQMGIILLNSRIFGDNRKVRAPPKLKSFLKKEFNPAYHVRFLENEQWPKNSMIYRQVMKSGEAPWIIAVQRQLVGGAVVTKEVLRSEEEPKEAAIDMAFKKYAESSDVSDKVADFLEQGD